MMTQKEIDNAQRELDEHNSINGAKVAEEINRLTNETFGVHLVTCGNCGAICNKKGGDVELLSSRDDGEIDEMLCNKCGFEGDPSDFPDFFY